MSIEEFKTKVKEYGEHPTRELMIEILEFALDNRNPYVYSIIVGEGD